MIMVTHAASRATRIAMINPSAPPTVLQVDPLLSVLRILKSLLGSVAKISDGALLLDGRIVVVIKFPISVTVVQSHLRPSSLYRANTQQV